eukprot:COSAG03_NODE_2046_length_3188_cov_34.384914_1_plen_1023_part_10
MLSMAVLLPSRFPLGGPQQLPFFSTAPLPTPLDEELWLLERSAAKLKAENARLARQLRDARRAAARVVRFAPPRPRPAAKLLPRHCYRLTLALARWRAQFGGEVELRPALSYWASWGAASMARTIAALRQNHYVRRLRRRATVANYSRLVSAPFTAWRGLSKTGGRVRLQRRRRAQRLAWSLLQRWREETADTRFQRYMDMKATVFFSTRWLRACWAGWCSFASWNREHRKIFQAQRAAAGRLFRAWCLRHCFAQWAIAAAELMFEHQVDLKRPAWLQRSTFAAWSIWTAGRRGTHARKAQAQAHWAAVHQMSVLLALADLVPKLQASHDWKEQLHLKAIKHDFARRLAQPFQRWSVYAYQLAMVREMTKAIELKQMATVFRSINMHRLEAVFNKDIDKRADRHFRMTVLWRAFCVWRASTEDTRRLRELARYLVARMRNLNLVLVWERWVNRVAARIHFGTVTTAIQACIRAIYLPLHFRAWNLWLVARGNAKRVAQHRVLRSWQRAIRYTVYRRYWLWWCRFVAANAEERDAAEAAKNEKMKSILGRLRHRTEAQTFTAWAHLATTMRAVRRIAAAIAMRPVRTALNAWVEMWQAKKSVFDLIRGVLSKIQNGLLASVLEHWAETVDEIIVSRMTDDLVERQLRRWQDIGRAAELVSRWLKKRRERQALEHKIEARTTGRARRLDDLREQASRQRILSDSSHPLCQCWMYVSNPPSRVRVQLWIDIDGNPAAPTLFVKSVERESTTARSKAARMLAPFQTLAQRRTQVSELKAKDGRNLRPKRTKAEDTQLADLTQDIDRLEAMADTARELTTGMPINLDSISHLVWGCRSPHFQALLQRRSPSGPRLHYDDRTWRCFSVAYHSSARRSAGSSSTYVDSSLRDDTYQWLDLSCESDESMSTWYVGLQSFISAQSLRVTDDSMLPREQSRHTHVTSRQLMLWVLHAKVAAKTAKVLLEPVNHGQHHSLPRLTPATDDPAAGEDNSLYGTWISHIDACKLSFEEGQRVSPVSVVAWLKGIFNH